MTSKGLVPVARSTRKLTSSVEWSVHARVTSVGPSTTAWRSEGAAGAAGPGPGSSRGRVTRATSDQPDGPAAFTARTRYAYVWPASRSPSACQAVSAARVVKGTKAESPVARSSSKPVSSVELSDQLRATVDALTATAL